jgi:hypothetical protein
MFINELIQKRACCPICGNKVPFAKRMRVSIINNIACPHCHSHLTLSNPVFLIKILLLALLLPTFFYIFTKHHYYLGSLILLIQNIFWVLVTYTAEFKVDWINKNYSTETR